jgi:MFS superfamily sulfate permease-like transporter
VLAWFFGILFFIFLLFWPAMFLKGTQALYTELGWLGAIIAVIVTTVLVKANSPEIREREREE